MKNKKKKGTFITRNLGFLYSKGQYIILPDPDDIISKNIIKECFIYANKFNYEIIKFNAYIGKKKLLFQNLFDEFQENTIYQPELSTYIYYRNNILSIFEYNIWNKFIKKEVYAKALNVLKKNYLNL